MEITREVRVRLALLSAVLGPLALAVLLVPFRSTFASSAAALLFVPVIVGVAVTGSRFSGYVASVSAAAWFDFFLTQPYQRLAISHRTDLETTLALLAVGVIVTELAARSRHHHQSASNESRFVEMTHELTTLAAQGEPEQVLTSHACASITELLSLKSCRFQRRPSERTLPAIDADGQIVHAGILWPIDQAGIPGPEAEIVAKTKGAVVGHFILAPTPGQPVGLKQRLVAYSLVDIVGTALTEPGAAE